jgi:hypothetical protein
MSRDLEIKRPKVLLYPDISTNLTTDRDHQKESEHFSVQRDLEYCTSLVSVVDRQKRGSSFLLNRSSRRLVENDGLIREATPVRASRRQREWQLWIALRYSRRNPVAPPLFKKLSDG